jgi:hypothetical protein
MAAISIMGRDVRVEFQDEWATRVWPSDRNGLVWGGRGRGRFAAPANQACRRGGISGSCSGSSINKRWAAVILAHLVQVWKAGGLLSKQVLYPSLAALFMCRFALIHLVCWI